MARKFNNSQSGNKKPSNSYTSPPRGNKIQKDTKKDNLKPTINQPKPQSSNPPQQSNKFVPPPPLVQNQVPSKALTEASKNNLAKLASINKLMGVGMESGLKPIKTN